MTLSAKSQHASNAKADSEAPGSKLKELRDQLRSRKGLIDAEIRNYPTPIPHCDAQFNHLLDLRTRLSIEVERLDAIAAEGSVPEHFNEIESFIASLEADDKS